MDPFSIDPHFSGEDCFEKGNTEPETLETAVVDMKTEPPSSGNDYTNRDHYCVICGNSLDVLLVKQEIIEENAVSNQQTSLSVEWSDEELAAFQWLLKWYRVKLSRKCLWNSGVDIFPFCVPCKFELKFLVDTQLKLKELDEALKNGIKELKRKVQSCEQNFKSGQIYKKDRRYRRLRAHIYCGKETPSLSTIRRGPGRPRIGPEELHLSQSVFPKIDLHGDRGNTSKFGRRLKPVSHFGTEHEMLMPKVVLSAEDQQKAERHATLKLDPEFLLTDSIGKQEKPTRKRALKRKRSEELPILNENAGVQSEVLEVSSPPPVRNEKLEDEENSIGKETTALGKRQRKTAERVGDSNSYSDRDEDFFLSENDMVDIESSEADATDSDVEELLPVGKRKRGPKKKKKKDKNAPKKKRIYRRDKMCSICGKPLYTRWQVEKHEWTHMSKAEKDAMFESGQVPKSLISEYKPAFQCDECGMEFKNRSNFNEHKSLVHSSVEEVGQLCPHCGKSYKYLKMHIKNAHEQKKGEFECGICGKVYPTLKGRTSHKQTVHMQLSKFTCTMCPEPRGFFSKYAYDQHIRGHLNIRPFKCDQCDLAFTIKAVMERHRKKFHEGGNPRRPAYIRGRTKNAKYGVGILDRTDSKPEIPVTSVPTDSNNWN